LYAQINLEKGEKFELAELAGNLLQYIQKSFLKLKLFDNIDKFMIFFQTIESGLKIFHRV